MRKHLNNLWIIIAAIPLLLVAVAALGQADVSDAESAATRGGYMDWHRAWGGEGVFDRGMDTCVDRDGNVYVAGIFSFDVDFDPGPGVTRHDMRNSFFLSKFDSSGGFQWVRTWEGAGINAEPSIAIGDDGVVLVAGWVHGSGIDLDPGPARSDYDAQQNHAFVSRFDTNGDFLWVKTWGGDWWAQCFDIDLDATGNIFVSGCFGGEADLDPGEGVYLVACNGRLDSFLSRLGPDGDLDWTRTWGGPGGEGMECDAAYGIEVTGDGYIILT